jgi:PAS domain S-box-containing protein
LPDGQFLWTAFPQRLDPNAPTFVSENIKRLLGYCPDEYLKNADVEAGQAKLFTDGRNVAEDRFRKADGIYCWVSDEQHLVRDQNGNPLEVIGSWSEVTERKTAEQKALAESEQHRTVRLRRRAA